MDERNRRGVLLVQSDPTLRAAAAWWLRFQGSPEVVGEADRAIEALSNVRRLSHKRRVVVAVDLDLAGEPDAFWLIRAIRGYAPTLTVVALGDGQEIAASRAYLMGADAVVHQARGLANWLSNEDSPGRGMPGAD